MKRMIGRRTPDCNVRFDKGGMIHGTAGKYPVGASIDRATGKIIPITREGGQDEMNALIERLAKAGLGVGI